MKIFRFVLTVRYDENRSVIFRIWLDCLSSFSGSTFTNKISCSLSVAFTQLVLTSVYFLYFGQGKAWLASAVFCKESEREN